VAVVIAVLLFLANGGVVPLSEAALAQRLATGGLDAGRYGRVRVGVAGLHRGGAGVRRAAAMAGHRRLPVAGGGLLRLLLVASCACPPAPSRAPARRTGAAVLPLLRQPAVAWFFASVFFTVLAHTSAVRLPVAVPGAQGYGKSAVGALWAVSVAAEIAFFWCRGAGSTACRRMGWLQLAAAVSGAALSRHGGASARSWWCWCWPRPLHAADLCRPACGLHRAGQPPLPRPLRGRGQALYTVLGYGLSGVLGGVAAAGSKQLPRRFAPASRPAGRLALAGDRQSAGTVYRPGSAPRGGGQCLRAAGRH
jgi:PPP family 3-phenylpropionic acid transporter